MGNIPRQPEKPVPIKVGKKSTSAQEKSNFVTAHMKIVDYLVAMLEDCKTILPLYTSVECARDQETIRVRMLHEGISFATKTLPAFFDSVLCYLETGVSDYASFKQDASGCPVFLRQLTSPMYEAPYDVSTAESMKCLYQLCVAFKKLEGPYAKGVVQKQLMDFIKVDRGLSESYPRVFQEKILEIASNLIGDVVTGLNPFDRDQADLFLPRPGPGATNTPTEKYMRYRPHVRYTNLADFKHEEWYQPFSMHTQFNRWDLRVGPKSYALRDLPERMASTARFEFVPKTFAKARGICIEELEIQWLQQGVRNAMYKTIERHPLTRGYVNFTDQSINGELALINSLTCERSTVDMSDASDRNARVLVKRLFKRNKNLRKALLMLSTRVIKLPEAPGIPKHLACKKFAPMGSALCFPVMGLVLWALIKSLMLYFRVPRKDAQVWVYGDDIICSSKYTHFVYKFLPLFDWKVNTGKSFVKSRFRESCGIHAYNGVDITPTRFKRLVKFPPQNDDLIANLRYEGELFKKGFCNTAAVFRRDILHLKQFGAKTFPKVSEKSPVLGWIREFGDALPDCNFRTRWTSEPTRFQYKVRVLKPAVEKPPLLCDVDGYLRYLTAKPDNARYVGGRSTGLQIRREWVTCQDVQPMSEIKRSILDYFRIER